MLIATKVGHTRPSPAAWTPCGRPEYLRQAAELCLRRLQVERIDLLQLHRIDPAVPIPGTSSIGHLEENVAAAGLELTPDHLARLAALGPVG